VDNLTHTLYGLALANTGLRRTAPHATLTLIIAANLPDVDLLSLFWGQIHYLKYHRGITHSLCGVILGALLLASAVYCVNECMLKKSPSNWGKLFGLALLGIGSHVLLDYTNSYGIRPFWPFSGRWYAWDIVFIIDPWILLVLTLGLGTPFLFRLINQEIGAKPTKSYGGAVLCLATIFLYWIAKDVSHRETIADLTHRTYPTGSVLRVGAFPQLLDPFGWYGIVETGTAYHKLTVGRGLSFDDSQTADRTIHKADQISIVTSASKGLYAQTFLDFARFPLFEAEPSEQGYIVSLRDLRFDFASRVRRGFLCTIRLDEHFKIISEDFHF
jgi:inner membrane protein